MSSSVSLAPSSAAPAPSASAAPSGFGNDSANPGCTYANPHCWAKKSNSSAESCCYKVNANWKSQCDACFFPDASKAKNQSEEWMKCWGADADCMVEVKKEEPAAKGAAFSVAPKTQLLALVFGAALFTLA